MTTSNSKNADESDGSNETSWLSTRAYERDSTAVIGSHPVDEKVLEQRAKRRRLGAIGRSIFSRVGQIVAVLLAIGVIGMAGLLAFSSDAQTQTSRSIQAFAAQRMTTCAQGYAGILNICVLFPTAELYARGDVDGIIGIKDSFIAYSEGSSTPPVDDALPRDGKATYTGYSKALTGGTTSSGTATAKESDTLLKTPHTPQAPGGLRLAMRGTRELHARWHKVDGATQYRIKMWAKEGMRKGKERTVHTGSTEVNIPVFPEDTDEDENTDTETEYTVEVEPINPAGPGQKAESTTTTPPAAQTTTPPAPSTVKGVKATVSSATGVDLSWDSADNATSYIVQRATNTAFSTDKKEYLVGNIQRYNINDLQTGVTYYFRVQASNKGVTGNWSSHASATTLLASPAWIEVTPSSRGVLVVQWSKSGAASEYEVQYSTASNFLLAPTKTVSSTSLTLTQLKDDTMYFVRVKAKGSQMSSDWSNSVAATTQQSPPAVPTGVKVTAGSGGTALVEWSAVDGATSYEIRYFSDNDATVTRHSSTTNVKLVNMSDATKYTVMVRAKNATGTSEWSSDTPLTTSTQPPAVPTGVTATVNSTTAITVKWNAVAGAERYSLVYSTSSSLTGSTSIANITATSRQVTGLKAGTTYYFAVIAHNAGGNVGSSATISAKTQTTTTPTPAPAPAPSTPTPAPAPSTPKEEVSTPAPSKPIGGCYWNPDVKQPSGEMYHIPDAPDPTPYAFSNSPEGVKYAAENKSASGKKYTRIDIDLRVTSDGVIVATHTAAVFGTDKKEAGFVDPKGEYKAGSTKGIGDIPWSVAQRLEHTYNGKKYNIHKVEAIIKQAKASGIALQFELKSSSQWQSKKLLPKLLAAVNKEKVEAYVFTKTTTTDWKQNLDYSSKIGFWTRHTGEDSPWVASQPTASECNKL